MSLTKAQKQLLSKLTKDPLSAASSRPMPQASMHRVTADMLHVMHEYALSKSIDGSGDLAIVQQAFAAWLLADAPDRDPSYLDNPSF